MTQQETLNYLLFSLHFVAHLRAPVYVRYITWLASSSKERSNGKMSLCCIQLLQTRYTCGM